MDKVVMDLHADLMLICALKLYLKGSPASFSSNDSAAVQRPVKIHKAICNEGCVHILQRIFLRHSLSARHNPIVRPIKKDAPSS